MRMHYPPRLPGDENDPEGDPPSADPAHDVPAEATGIDPEEDAGADGPPCMLPSRPMAACLADPALVQITDEPYFLPSEHDWLAAAERPLRNTGAVTGYLACDPDGGRLENGSKYPGGYLWACRIFRPASQIRGAEVRRGHRLSPSVLKKSKT